MIENLILKPLANIAAQPWQVIVATLVFFVAFSFVFYIFVETFTGIGRLIGRCLVERNRRNLLLLGLVLPLLGCASDADVASRNLSQAADNFEIARRVIFYNGITGDYMLSIEGQCSLGTGQAVKAVTVTCKTGPNQYKKHYLGLSDNVTYFAEQIEPAKTGVSFYRVIFKPSVIIPDIDVR